MTRRSQPTTQRQQHAHTPTDPLRARIDIDI
jgi:hypothetical protein